MRLKLPQEQILALQDMTEREKGKKEKEKRKSIQISLTWNRRVTHLDQGWRNECSTSKDMVQCFLFFIFVMPLVCIPFIAIGGCAKFTNTVIVCLWSCEMQLHLLQFIQILEDRVQNLAHKKSCFLFISTYSTYISHGAFR